MLCWWQSGSNTLLASNISNVTPHIDNIICTSASLSDLHTYTTTSGKYPRFINHFEGTRATSRKDPIAPRAEVDRLLHKAQNVLYTISIIRIVTISQPCGGLPLASTNAAKIPKGLSRT